MKKLKGLKNQKLLMIIASIAVILIGLFLVVKTTYLNKPKQTPKEITNNFISSMEQNDKNKMADLKNKYYTQKLRDKMAKENSDSQETTNESGIIFTITNESVQKSNADYVLETKVPLLGSVQIKMKYIKTGNFWKGYKWMIDDIIYPDFGNSNSQSSSKNAKLNEGVSLTEGWTLTIFTIEDYQSNSEWEKPASGNKFVAIDVQYENNSSSPGDYSSYNFSLKDASGHTYQESTNGTKQPSLSSNTLPAKQKARGFVTFEVPSNEKITQINYSSSSGGTIVWNL
jgi:hypothetical protein